MTFLGIAAGYLLTSLIVSLLLGRWLRGSNAQEEVDGEETANCLRFLLKRHPELMG